jgi:hypothetical protein
VAAEPATRPSSIKTIEDIGNCLGLVFRGQPVAFSSDVTLPRSYVRLETLQVVDITIHQLKPCLVPYVSSLALPFIFADMPTVERPFATLAPSMHGLGLHRIDIDVTGVDYRTACVVQIRKVLEHVERVLSGAWTQAADRNICSYTVVSRFISGGGRFPGVNS